MNVASFLFDALRVAVLLGVALAGGAVIGRSSARTRRSLVVAAMVAALVAPLAARALSASNASAVVDWPLLSFAPAVEPVGVEPVSPAVLQVGERSAVVRGGPATIDAPPSRMKATTLLFVVWILGVAVVLARFGYGVVGARRLVRRAHRGDAGSFAAVIAQAVRDTNVRAEVAISDDVATPAVAGLFVPTVLMPRAALAWTESRWRVVLLHELAHVRGRDCFVGAIAELVCAVHWFDPLAWLTRARWRKERELAADENVVAYGVRPSDYATHLLDVAGAVDARETPRGVLAMAGQPTELAHRLEMIVRRHPGHPPSCRATIGIAVLGSGLTLAVACAGPADPSLPDHRRGGEVGPSQVAPGSSAALVTRSREPAASSVAELAARVVEVIGGTAEQNELTIDPRLQVIADEEAARVVATVPARSATAIILDPMKGEILALANPDLARRALITGSTMKALTIAAALDAGVVRVDQKFDCTPRAGESPQIRDVESHGLLDLAGILEVSSNVGALRVYQALGDVRFERALDRFHLGDEEPAVQLKVARFAPAGVPRPNVIQGEEAEGAVGEGFVTTPLQMLTVYAIFANGGEYVRPTLVRSVRDEAGRTYWRNTPQRAMVVRPETAQAVMGMLERAVDGPNATGKAARVPGVRVAGKTGTSALHEPEMSQVYASFIGIVPADAPKFVILVGAIDPGEGGWGGTVAAPAFARIAARALSLR